VEDPKPNDPHGEVTLNFSCTLVIIELQLQKDFSTCFVFDFNFVNNLKFILNHLT
jgi:hypothetical protein